MDLHNSTRVEISECLFRGIGGTNQGRNVIQPRSVFYMENHRMSNLEWQQNTAQNDRMNRGV